jgi:2-dehydro-3-deoxyphosphogluconate aldolase / (4S)-4-hydroxy-2-oxoglutarate aldolase
MSMVMFWWWMVVGLPAEVLWGLEAARVVGVLRTNSSQAAVATALSAVRGGLRAIELTFTTPKVETALDELRQKLPEGVLLGVGTVLNLTQARTALQAGAKFLVSPHFSPKLLEFATSQNVLYLPGVMTPSEMVTAQEMGALALKLFPAESSGGIRYLQDILSPLPHLKLMATGGIQPQQTAGYLKAGAIAVGLGGQLFPKIAIETGDWQAVENATRSALEAANG